MLRTFFIALYFVSSTLYKDTKQNFNVIFFQNYSVVGDAFLRVVGDVFLILALNFLLSVSSFFSRSISLSNILFSFNIFAELDLLSVSTWLSWFLSETTVFSRYSFWRTTSFWEVASVSCSAAGPSPAPCLLHNKLRTTVHFSTDFKKIKYNCRVLLFPITFLPDNTKIHAFCLFQQENEWTNKNSFVH